MTPSPFEPKLASMAAVIADATRARMLCYLLAGEYASAGELAKAASVAPSTASGHLGKLMDSELLVCEQRGRHRYYRLADADVARLLESLMGVAFRSGAVRLKSSPREPAMRLARVCYDHLAGELAVQAYESALAQGWLHADGGEVSLTGAGRVGFAHLGVEADKLVRTRRPLCRACLDWSERRHHLAGTLGAALLQRLFELGWARRSPSSRVVTFTAVGEQNFRAWFSGGVRPC
jgi:DNA-binding transcriptional ArsR family regulator